MKTLFRPLIVLVCTAVAFSSCMKDDSADREAEARRQEEAIVAAIAADKSKVEAYVTYVMANPSEGPGSWKEDDTKYPMYYVTPPKRGIWFEVLAEPTAEDDAAYEYKINTQGNITMPKVKVNYSVSLLDGDEPIQSKENASIDFSTFANSAPNVANQLWFWAFIPKTIEYNTNDVEVGGLTAKGLKKGSKIRVVTPSIWAFGTKATEVDGKTIPANSPLVYVFEVLSIEE